MAVTALGDIRATPILRSGAHPGDVVVHAGTLGRSAAGLALLDAGREVREGAAGRCIETYLRPAPPVGVALAGKLHSLMDVSDGLLRDAGRMARKSGVVFDLIDPEELVDDDVREIAELLGADARKWVAGGGEDHGFLGTCAPDAVPEGFRVIGTVTEDGPAVTIQGESPSGVTGWDHFAG